MTYPQSDLHQNTYLTGYTKMKAITRQPGGNKNTSSIINSLTLDSVRRVAFRKYHADMLFQVIT